MWIRLQPLDTVFFRDGKPFSQGEETWSDSVFPPFPSVFYGALRTLYFTQHPDKLKEWYQQDQDATAQLRITSIYLESQDEQLHYLPSPRDIVVFNKRQKHKKELTFLTTTPYAQTSNPAPYLLTVPAGHDSKAEEPDELFESASYQKYLQGALENTGFISFPYIRESKVGIGRDDTTHAAGAEGRLYRVEMLRLATHKKRLYQPEQWAFLLEFHGLELEKGVGILKLGGEHKAARYEIKDARPDTLSPPSTPFKQFKLCLTTPAIFNNGWYPDLGEKWGAEVKLLAAAVGKPQFIGGFDMKKRQPKPMYRAVPAGSVYYFQCSAQCSQDLVTQLHGKSISDIYPQQGFGLGFIGAIQADLLNQFLDKTV